ncbi:hypothetical protein PINS_up022429 [Pythium insidiosum]|nr:hypothetical protein PINS_up022429 [Pythium insidiosum]
MVLKTDVESCSALALRKSVQSASASASSLLSVDGSHNQHEDAVVDLDRRLLDAKRRWTEHQEEAFAAQIDALQSSSTPTPTPRRTTSARQQQQQLQSDSTDSMALLHALDTAHSFLQR